MSGSNKEFNPNLPFGDVLAMAIADLSASGYVSQTKLDLWMARLRNAAERDLGPDWQTDVEVRASLNNLFEKFTDGIKLPQRVEGVGRFTLQQVRPKLYAELDRRIAANADLIKLHKQEAVERTLRRFSGWATSIPPGGDETVDKRETRSAIGKDMREYRFVKRRCDTDQGHKLIANVAQIVAEDVGAIAGRWNSHGAHDSSYNARKPHLDRDGKIYLIKGSWADKEGLVKPVNGYTEDITAPGQEVSCRCWYTYITSPRKLPDEMLTRKGQEWIARGKAELQRRMAMT